MKKFARFASYLNAFVLGMYACSQFRFGTPVEPHRWIITSIVFVFMLSLANDKK